MFITFTLFDENDEDRLIVVNSNFVISVETVDVDDVEGFEDDYEDVTEITLTNGRKILVDENLDYAMSSFEK